MIYIFKTQSNPSFMKIGFSKDGPVKRLSSVQTGCPFKLEIYAIRKGSTIHESILHGEFRDHHSYGEWFHWNEDSAARLNELFVKWKMVDAARMPKTQHSGRRRMSEEKTRTIMEHLNSGKTTRETAQILGINRHTVMRHSKHAASIVLPGK